jgi:hypothetical protein
MYWATGDIDVARFLLNYMSKATLIRVLSKLRR